MPRPTPPGGIVPHAIVKLPTGSSSDLLLLFDVSCIAVDKYGDCVQEGRCGSVALCLVCVLLVCLLMHGDSREHIFCVVAYLLCEASLGICPAYWEHHGSTRIVAVPCTIKATCV